MVVGVGCRVVVAQRLLETIVRCGASRHVVAAAACALWLASEPDEPHVEAVPHLGRRRRRGTKEL